MTNNNNQNASRFTKEQGQVKVLPPEERENFKGITIEVGNDGNGNQEQNNRGYYEYDYRDPQKRVYSRRVILNSSLFNWLTIGFLALTIIFILLPFFYLFIPLLIPLFFFILLSNLLRRR
mgnify:CR=1 FL=1